MNDEQYLRDCFTIDADNENPADKMDMNDDGICELEKLSIHNQSIKKDIDLVETSYVNNTDAHASQNKNDQCEPLSSHAIHETGSNEAKNPQNVPNDSETNEQSPADCVSENIYLFREIDLVYRFFLKLSIVSRN